MKKLLCVMFGAMMLVSTTVDAKGGRGFSGGRSFSRPSVSKSYTPKRPVVERKTSATPSSSTTGTPVVAQTNNKKEESDSTAGGFWAGLFGSAAGSMAGNVVYDAVTKDEKKEAPAAK